MRLVVALCIICLCYVVSGDLQCKDFKTCGTCISYSQDNCAWCSAVSSHTVYNERRQLRFTNLSGPETITNALFVKSFQKEHSGERCRSKLYVQMNKLWCKDNNIYNPEPEIIVISNHNFSSGDATSNIVQLRPQNLRIKVRPGIPVKFVMSYKPAKDFPLDVYYVMDTSFSMTPHIDKLSKQGVKIHKELTKITNNVRLGIGSFIEKPGEPFSKHQTRNIIYSFNNNLKLTENMSQFVEAVKNIRVMGNKDNPEADFDALMQAIVCKEEVGWRENARRIIVLSTDEMYHSAGDGKMCGAYKPHDMRCHLKDNIYNESLVYDYPSASQIGQVVRDNNIKIIFAIVERSQSYYKLLEKIIPGAKVVLLDDKHDSVNMIINEYNELVRNVLLEGDFPSFVQILAEPDCTQYNNHCRIIKNKPLYINITLIVNECPDRTGTTQFQIGVNSLKEKLKINLIADCKCKCEKPGQGIKNSSMCHESGTYQCGICACNKNRYGSTCRCNGTSTDIDGLDSCVAKNDSIPCSGRGTCRCGICEECNAGFSGEFCQYDDNGCPRPGGMLCSGNGKCKFGKCKCDIGWTDVTDCLCPDHNRSCMAPQSKEICSGNGNCNCGKCECFLPNENYDDHCTGRYCEKCNRNALKICKELEDYVICLKSEDKTNCDEKYNNNTYVKVAIMNRTELDSDREYLTARGCENVLKNGSILIFKYDFSSDPPTVIIQNELEMQPKANIWIAIGSAIGAVLLIGIMTVIIWKYLIDLHDAREYQKFKEKSEAAGFDVSNPCYREPVQNFGNPLFNTSNDQ